MTPPKKWYIDEEGRGYVLKYDNGTLIKKPNASKTLGKIISVSVGDKEMFKHEGVKVRDSN